MKRSKLLNLCDVLLDKEFKIAGTQFDRRRKLNEKEIKTMQKLYNQGKPIADICILFKVTYPTVKYHCEQGNKEFVNMMRRLYGNNSQCKCNFKNRCQYKRLILSNKLA